jgi:hypothetical protein
MTRDGINFESFDVESWQKADEQRDAKRNADKTNPSAKARGLWCQPANLLAQAILKRRILHLNLHSSSK